MLSAVQSEKKCNCKKTAKITSVCMVPNLEKCTTCFPLKCQMTRKYDQRKCIKYIDCFEIIQKNTNTNLDAEDKEGNSVIYNLIIVFVCIVFLLVFACMCCFLKKQKTTTYNDISLD